MSDVIPNNVNIYKNTATYVYVNEESPNNVNVYQDTPNRVYVNQDSPNIVLIRSSSSSSFLTKRYIHNQPSVSTLWQITHNLGGRPSITIVDSAGTVVFGDVTYISNTQIEVEFTSPFSGQAYLT